MESAVSTRWAAKPLVPVLLVALGSVSLALVIAGQQAQPLGDDPLRMLLACGVLAGLAGVLELGTPPWLGLAATCGFPVWAVLDLARHGGHSLLPFEFAFYAAYGAMGMLVAFVGRSLRASMRRVATG